MFDATILMQGPNTASPSELDPTTSSSVEVDATSFVSSIDFKTSSDFVSMISGHSVEKVSRKIEGRAFILLFFVYVATSISEYHDLIVSKNTGIVVFRLCLAMYRMVSRIMPIFLRLL